MVQQKKTEPDPFKDLPTLTKRQYAYVMARMAGKRQQDAFREAYTAENSTIQTIWVNAWKVENHPKVRQWLEVIRLERANTAGYTHDQYMQELEEMRQIAIRSGNIGTAVIATVAKGKTAGHITEQFKDTGKPANHVNSLRQLTEIAGKDVAYRIAEQMGYTHKEAVEMLKLSTEDIQAVQKLTEKKSPGEMVSRELH